VSRVAEQRRQAGALGTEVRSRRAAAKARIAAGDVGLPGILRGSYGSIPVVAANVDDIPIGQLVRSVPGIGRATSTAILTDLSINPERPMGELPDAERRRLADEIERSTEV
jgi:hypothetical protein